MSMPKHSLPLRLAHSLLRLALRLWPRESRQWGQALAGELDEIENPWEAFHWAIGGLVLFTRASFSHFFSWLKRPAGARLSAASLPLGTDPPILPKHSRLLTATILLITAAILFLPPSREAISTVRASWNGFQGYSSDIRAVRNLAARAEKEKDARTLAFAALATPDRDRSIALADRAVAIDPSFAWIYAGYTTHRNYALASKDGLARLLSADPDNAFPELAAARTISQPLFLNLISHHSPTQNEIETSLASNPEWLAYMDRAFRASRYDSYLNRHWQLTREVWSQQQDLSASVIFNVLWARPFPDVQSIRTYSNHLVHSSQEASAAGRLDEAEALLKRVDDFGRRMSDQGETDFERMVGMSVSHQALSEMRNLYHAQGRDREAQGAVQQLQDVEGRMESLRYSFRAGNPAELRAFDRRAFLVQLAAGLALLFAIAAAFGLFALELSPSKRGHQRIRMRRVLCIAADWAPAALLFGSIALLWLFQPYAQLLRSARNLGSASEAWHSMNFGGLSSLSSTLGALEEPFTPVRLWQAFICALVALALFILVRGFLRFKRA